jgi:hypothetical protein
MLILGSLHFSAAVSAHTSKNEDGFWQFNRRLFQGFCVAALHTGVLIFGLELALLSASKLFGFRFEKAYADLFVFISGCVHPIFFLKSVPSDFQALRSDTEHPRGLKAFTQFALAPLVAVFTLILYAYGAKISLSRHWPQGWVAFPVLLVSGFGILSFLLLHPLRERNEEKWACWFCRWFPRALAPLSILLLLALRERIEAYGFTEERYLGLSAGGCILLWALVTSLNRRAGIRWLPIVLGAVVLLSALGPWSAGQVSLKSQMTRIENLMAKHGLLVERKVTIPEERLKLPQKEFSELKDTLNYISGRHGAGPLRPFLSQAIADKEQTRWMLTESIIKHLRIYGDSYNSNSDEIFELDHNVAIPIEGFSRASAVVDLQSFSHAVRSGKLWLKIDKTSLNASEEEKGPYEEIPLEPLYAALKKSPAPPDQMSFDWEYNGHTYRLVFIKLRLVRSGDGPSGLSYCSLLILEK